MNCKRTGEISTGCLADELSGAEKAEFLEHLKGCDSCRKEMELLSKSWQALGIYETPLLGDGFVDSLMARIRSGQLQEEGAVSSFNPFGLSASARAALAGWWKVPALTMASCVIYLVCIETGLMPSRQLAPLASTVSQDGTETLSAMLSDTQTQDEGHILTLVSEGADK